MGRNDLITFFYFVETSKAFSGVEFPLSKPWPRLRRLRGCTGTPYYFLRGILVFLGLALLEGRVFIGV